MNHQYQNIRQALSKLQTWASKVASMEFLNSLGYSSERSHIGMTGNQSEHFIDAFYNKIENADTFKKNALVSEWKAVDFLFQITKDELFSNTDTTKKSVEKDRFDSYLFFAVELRKIQYSKTELGKISREINRLFDMPVMLVFQYSGKVSLSVSQRRINRIDDTKDVILKSVILKDLSCENPRNAHIRILSEMSQEAVLKRANPKDFEDFHEALKQTLSKSVLNKQFYGHIQNFFSRLDRSNELKDAILQAWIHYGTDAESEKIQHGALRLILRLLFVHFLSEKGGIVSDKDGNTLIEHVKLNVEKTAGWLHANLESLFFDALNRKSDDKDKSQLWSKTKYLNGGLFSKKIEDGDGAIVLIPDVFYYNPDFHIENFNKDSSKQDAGIFNIFESFVFTVEEGISDDVTFGVDPEMLGNILENILGSIINEETKESARSANGAFYTPKEIVDYMVRSSLYEALSEKFGITDCTNLEELTENIRKDIATGNMKKEFFESAIYSLKILDPACGSGAFPMGILSVMTELVQKAMPNRQTAYETKLKLMEHCLYGVDIKPMAVEMCHLRYFLSLLEDMDTMNVESIPHEGVLPNLHFHFSVANTLLRLPESNQTQLGCEDIDNLISELSKEKQKWFFCNGNKDKDEIQSKYWNLVNRYAIHNDCSAKLKEYNPFNISKSSGFYDPSLFHSIKDGFDIVIGNPPYIWIQKFARTQTQKDLENAHYKTFEKRGDIYALFYERGISLSKPKSGLLSFITSNKWMRAWYGEKLRSYFVQHDPKILVDCGPGIFESATVDVNILLIRNTSAKSMVVNALTLQKNEREHIAEAVEKRGIILTELSKDPWFIGSNAEISLKKKIESTGKPLKEWDIKMCFWIKTGFNKAFIIDSTTRNRLIAEDPKSKEIIKPICEGKDIQRYGSEFGELYMIVAKYGFADEIIKNYPSIFKHLKDYEQKLRERGQCNTSRSGKEIAGNIGETWQHHWLELDNNPRDTYLKLFEEEKIVWREITSTQSFCLVPGGISVYAPATFLIAKNNLKYILGFLNSKVAMWGFSLIAHNLWATGLEWKKAKIETLSMPLVTLANKPIISTIESLTTQIIDSKKSNPNANTQPLEDIINRLVYGLYNLTYDEVLIIEPSIAMTQESYDAFIQKHFKSLEIQKTAISKSTRLSLEELKSFIQSRLEVLNAHQRVRISMPQDSKLQTILEFPERLPSIPGIDRRFIDLLGDEIAELLK